MTAVRRTQLIRFGIWIALATAAVLTAVIAARTEAGLRRIASLISPGQPAAVRSAKDVQLANRQFDQEAEQRRVSEAIRLLAADRDRLMARLNSLERGLDDVTGSISSGAKAPPASPPSINLPSINLPSMPAASAPAASNGSAQGATAAANPQGRVSAGHLATGNPAAAESVATKTEFGVDLGGNTTIEGLRTLWTALKAGQPALLEGLRPVVALREGPKPGSIDLRLVAGPLANASVAARVCATLAAAGQPCQPTVFDGQRLALQ